MEIGTYHLYNLLIDHGYLSVATEICLEAYNRLSFSFISLIFITPDACRNFPQGTIGDMVADALQGISFVCNNITDYGGDPNR